MVLAAAMVNSSTRWWTHLARRWSHSCICRSGTPMGWSRNTCRGVPWRCNRVRNFHPGSMRRSTPRSSHTCCTRCTDPRCPTCSSDSRDSCRHNRPSPCCTTHRVLACRCPRRTPRSNCNHSSRRRTARRSRGARWQTSATSGSTCTRARWQHELFPASSRPLPTP